jgi:pyruvate dehydrogenase E2 component (dihydrolipoamide acetyltransferase)
MAIQDIQVPDIGDFDEVTVIELLVKPGDTIQADQSLLTVESDKASMEIPSSAAGVVKELRVALGDKVKQGSIVLTLETADTAEKVADSAPIPAAAQDKSAASATQSVAPAAAPASALTPAQAGASTAVEVHVPDIGDFKDVSVIEVLVKVGDTIKVEQSLITVESDKASMEIPSSAAGVLKDLKVKLGDVINIGDLLAVLEGSAQASAPAAVSPAPAPAAASPAPAAPAPAAAAAAPVVASASVAVKAPAHEPTVAPTGKLPHASPSVRKFARELGVPLAEVKGAGPKGRITLTDVQAFTQSVMDGSTRTQAQVSKAPAAAASGGAGIGIDLLPWPKVDFAKFGPVERKDMSRIKKISGANLLRNAVMIPAVTNHDDADITDLEAFRVSTNKENEKSGVKVTMLAFLIKACVAALKKFPEFNSSLDGDALIYKQYFHIAFAADTPNGLMVPVIKDADKKGIFQISTEMGELAKKARDGKLGPADMSGACFTISSLGGIGGRYFTPIINAPEVAILGVCKSQMEPVWDGKAFQPRLMLPLSLTWDHRVIDGAAAARFNVYLGQILADFRRVLL